MAVFTFCLLIHSLFLVLLVVNCTAPTLLHGSADKKTVSYLQHVNYTCNTGYRMNGSATATCNADGTLQLPTCNSKCSYMFIVDSLTAELKVEPYCEWR